MGIKLPVSVGVVVENGLEVVYVTDAAGFRICRCFARIGEAGWTSVMTAERIVCALNDAGNAQWVCSASEKTPMRITIGFKLLRWSPELNRYVTEEGRVGPFDSYARAAHLIKAMITTAPVYEEGGKVSCKVPSYYTLIELVQ